jgi:hypothetical protein
MHDPVKFAEIAKRRCVARFLSEANPMAHDYLATYQKILEGRSPKKIVEMGIGERGLFHKDQVTGSGLYMWQEAFPEAEVWGIDNRSDLLIQDGTIRSVLANQSDEESLRTAATVIGYGIDLFVDDGSHKPSDQVLTAKVFVPMLSRTGTYVIEDVLAGRECSMQLPYEHEVVELRTQLVVDDRLIVIEAAKIPIWSKKRA